MRLTLELITAIVCKMPRLSYSDRRDNIVTYPTPFLAMCNLILSSCLCSSLLSWRSCFSFESTMDTWFAAVSALISTSSNWCWSAALVLVNWPSCRLRSSFVAFIWFICTWSSSLLLLYRIISLFTSASVCSNFWERALDSSFHLENDKTYHCN